MNSKVQAFISKVNKITSLASNRSPNSIEIRYKILKIYQFSAEIQTNMKFFLACIAFAAFTAVQAEIFCSVPNCSVSSNRGRLWPSADATKFFQCSFESNGWIGRQLSCQCELLFSYLNQSCVLPQNWNRICSTHPVDPVPEVCPTVPGFPPTVPGTTTTTRAWSPPTVPLA